MQEDNCTSDRVIFFDVLLTVHLTIFISVINQLDAQNFCFTISFISCLYMFRAHVLIIRKSKLHYTASDTRGCVMQFGLPDDECMCITQPLVSSHL